MTTHVLPVRWIVCVLMFMKTGQCHTYPVRRTDHILPVRRTDYVLPLKRTVNVISVKISGGMNFLQGELYHCSLKRI